MMPGVQLVLAERRRDALDRLLLLVELHGQRAVVEDVRQVARRHPA